MSLLNMLNLVVELVMISIRVLIWKLPNISTPLSFHAPNPHVAFRKDAPYFALARPSQVYFRALFRRGVSTLVS
jgi:hypothetical protein